MSGAYQAGNYKIFVPQNAKGKYQKYANEVVVIVSITRDKRGGIQHAKIYLTAAVDKIMDRPKFVKLGESGSNIGIIPVEENDGEVYVVARKQAEDGASAGMPSINCDAFAKFYELDEGVYSAHKEPGGVIEFNRKSKPSRP